MKVFLKKDVEKVGMAGEMIKVNDGYARNFLFPHGLAVQITPTNEAFYTTQIKQVEHRKEVVATKTSMLAERIKRLALTIKRKMHDDGKLYGAVSTSDIVDLLSQEGVSISKSQVIFDKSIKERGAHEVTIKLTSSLQAPFKLTVLPE